MIRHTAVFRLKHDSGSALEKDFLKALAKLIVGAEGGLATVVESLVHLLPLPKVRGILVLHFDSMAHAVAAVGRAA